MVSHSLFKSPIVLASSSFSRKALLQNAGVDFVVSPSLVDEDAFKALGLSGYVLAHALSFQKSLSVASLYPDAYVIGSDQVLLLKDMILGKPESLAHAKATLKSLLGNTVELHNSIHVVQGTDAVFSHQESVFLTFVDSVPDGYWEHYLALEKDTLLHCIAGLRLEGLATSLITSMKGDYFTAMGLSLIPLLNFLRLR